MYGLHMPCVAKIIAYGIAKILKYVDVKSMVRIKISNKILNY
jgi:hypothetical protein